MKIELKQPKRVKIDKALTLMAEEAFQKALNRLYQGVIRYKHLTRDEIKAMTRMRKEYSAYKRTGNSEQLLNIIVYCILELTWPENKKFHFDSSVKSVTREDNNG